MIDDSECYLGKVLMWDFCTLKMSYLETDYVYVFFIFTSFFLKLYFDHSGNHKTPAKEIGKEAFQYFCLTTFFQILSIISMEFQEFFCIPIYLCLMIKRFTKVWTCELPKQTKKPTKTKNKQTRIK